MSGFLLFGSLRHYSTVNFSIEEEEEEEKGVRRQSFSLYHMLSQWNITERVMAETLFFQMHCCLGSRADSFFLLILI